jgi:small subunit ribosomal protein S8
MKKDLISNLLTKLRNASKVFHKFVDIEYSKINEEILKLLENEGYIQNYEIKSSREISVELRYNGWWTKSSFFSKIIRISKPGRKIYSSYKDFNKKVKGLNFEQGIIILSTSSGLMTHIKAKELKKGGEILFYIS